MVVEDGWVSNVDTIVVAVVGKDVPPANAHNFGLLHNVGTIRDANVHWRRSIQNVGTIGTIVLNGAAGFKT